MHLESAPKNNMDERLSVSEKSRKPLSELRTSGTLNMIKLRIDSEIANFEPLHLEVPRSTTVAQLKRLVRGKSRARNLTLSYNGSELRYVWKKSLLFFFVVRFVQVLCVLHSMFLGPTRAH